MRSERALRRARALVAATLLLAGCGSVFGLDDYEITEDTRCGGDLINLRSSFEHCGACDNTCRSREWCVAGSCVCEPDADACSGVCVDLASDERHCGACGSACPGDATCDDGVCECDDDELDLCSGACVDLTSDVDHCGACGDSCAAGASCDNGTCVCDDADLDVCSDRCVDLTTDEANCGRCGDACPTGATCTGADCACPSGEVVCGSECVDLSDDADHCGSCTNACDVPNAVAICRSGGCVGNDCEDGYGDCNGDLAAGESGDGCEVNTNSNEAHCGACGNVCRTDEQCSAGDCACVVPDVGGECSPSGCGCGIGEGCFYNSTEVSWVCSTSGSVGEGGSCTGNDDCIANHSCVSDVCRPYCGQGQPCTGGCSPVYVADEIVPEWNYCHPVCDPIPTSTRSPNPDCPLGQRCSLLSSGSTVCGPQSPSPGGMAARCDESADCQTGFYCNTAGHCTASCWMDNDTCTLIGSGLDCRGYVTPVLIDDDEVGACLPSQAAAGCKEPCTSDADCMVIGTRCINTTSGDICLNEQCEECFDQDISCFSDNDTCLFSECAP